MELDSPGENWYMPPPRAAYSKGHSEYSAAAGRPGKRDVLGSSRPAGKLGMGCNYAVRPSH